MALRSRQQTVPGAVMEQAPQRRLKSVNLSGELRLVEFAGEMIQTGFFKRPTEGRIQAHRLGLAGDAQADLKAHGGPDKAVYCYPAEHYAGWADMLGTEDLQPGSFGENLTTEGMYESDVCIGDVFQIGSAVLQVTQPRSPCYKLQIRFGRPDMVALFVKRGLPGWYAAVLESGEVQQTAEVRILSRAPEQISVADVWLYSLGCGTDARLKARILDLALLPEFWKARIGRPSR
jgi:MOSC domain-containing protein YiiM